VGTAPVTPPPPYRTYVPEQTRGALPLWRPHGYMPSFPDLGLDPSSTKDPIIQGGHRRPWDHGSMLARAFMCCCCVPLQPYARVHAELAISVPSDRAERSRRHCSSPASPSSPGPCVSLDLWSSQEQSRSRLLLDPMPTMENGPGHKATSDQSCFFVFPRKAH
jgi:hypothetical protein